jgi:hypothetical protein
MEVVDFDPLAVLPVTAPSASATFSRASDFSRGRDERHEQLRSLATTLASGEPTNVVHQDAIGTEQALHLSHPATVLRHLGCLVAVTASRPARAGLGEFTDENCVSSRHVPPLVQGRPRGG